MFEIVTQVAERAAIGVSRREWLGNIGRGALVVAASVGGLIAHASAASALVCGANSRSGCAGKPVGTPCALAPRKWGTCQQAPVCMCVSGAPR